MDYFNWADRKTRPQEQIRKELHEKLERTQPIGVIEHTADTATVRAIEQRQLKRNEP